jgi:hypothetical protein
MPLYQPARGKATWKPALPQLSRRVCAKRVFRAAPRPFLLLCPGPALSFPPFLRLVIAPVLGSPAADCGFGVGRWGPWPPSRGPRVRFRSRGAGWVGFRRGGGVPSSCRGPTTPAVPPRRPPGGRGRGATHRARASAALRKRHHDASSLPGCPFSAVARAFRAAPLAAAADINGSVASGSSQRRWCMRPVRERGSAGAAAQRYVPLGDRMDAPGC